MLERATVGDDRAMAIFDNLGVAQAVITWSTQVSGGPVFARRSMAQSSD
jgi:hypothetical protein